MTLTLLLDLDDTLLENNIEVFLPKYLQAFCSFIQQEVDPALFVEALLAGTRQMTLNQRPDCTLKEVFEEVFYSKVKIERLVFEKLADQFYTQVFPELQNLTRPVPGAREMVETAFERGYRIAIATNPLFPRSAIEQRLAWAGLPPHRYPFELVSAYDRFHFAKPDPAYFAEFLGYLHWPESGVVMVGDDLQRDILSASALGVPTYWIQADGMQPGSGQVLPTMTGSLDQVLAWLEAADYESLLVDYSTTAALLAVLRSTPAVLDSLLRNLEPGLWNIPPAPDAWGLTEVMCHLRDVDLEVNLPRVRRVQAEVNPFLPSEDTDAWARSRNYSSQDGRKALRQFTAIRMKLVDLLKSIEPETWESKVRHAIFGPTDLHELVVILAGHDRLHIRQVHEILDAITSKNP